MTYLHFLCIVGMLEIRVEIWKPESKLWVPQHAWPFPIASNSYTWGQQPRSRKSIGRTSYAISTTNNHKLSKSINLSKILTK
jgi:hypothetical protein